MFRLNTRIPNFLSAMFLTAGLCLTSLSAFALELSLEDRTALDQLSRYFNTVKTMNGEFLQIGPNGEQSQGLFYLQRPGKVRFYYKAPVYLDIIADGKTLAIKDRKLHTKDIYPLSKTPLSVLLSDNIDLANDDKLLFVQRDQDIVTIQVKQESLFGDGLLTLVFDGNSNLLRQWTIRDGQGYETTVTVYNIDIGRPIKQSLFVIDRTIFLRSNDDN